MKNDYIITNINSTINVGSITAVHKGRQIAMPGSPNYTVDITIQFIDIPSEELTIDTIKDILRKDSRIAPEAPSYQELIAKYHPEYLL